VDIGGDQEDVESAVGETSASVAITMRFQGSSGGLFFSGVLALSWQWSWICVKVLGDLDEFRMCGAFLPLCTTT